MITISTWIIWVWLAMWIILTILGFIATNRTFKAASAKLYDVISEMINIELNKRKEDAKEEVKKNA